ncbi:MAG: glycosyltransferase family 1 protein [Clostridia bacterium]|nr:glycosyltransferase family 1 protein [Clostridia bacterium]
MKAIRILHVVGAMEYGGMENYIMNLYRCMDRSEIQFDFLTHHGRRGTFEDEIEAMGGHIYHTTVTDDGNLIKYRRQLRRLYQEHPEYRIVHGHLGSMAYWYLGEAKRAGVPWRILHSHVPSYVRSVKGCAKNMLFRLSPLYANIHLACSPEAGQYQFRNKSFEIVHNGIDVRRFLYHERTRKEIRKELGVEGRFVVGHVGRFFPEKNHRFLLEMFCELKKSMDSAALLLVGGGYLMEDIQQLAVNLGLEKDVLFVGLQKDTSPYYQAMDAFVLPSLYEGFPLTGIEAQSAGLPCLFTDRVSPSLLITPNTKQLPPEDHQISAWVDALNEIGGKTIDRADISDSIWEYDADTVAKKMADRYCALLEKEA